MLIYVKTYAKEARRRKRYTADQLLTLALAKEALKEIPDIDDHRLIW